VGETERLPFEEKRNALNDHSLLVLNREITKKTVWDEDQIEARGEALLEVARKIWPYPREQE
jgi:hypothetical protein